jgi:hypothetical protein
MGSILPSASARCNTLYRTLTSVAGFAGKRRIQLAGRRFSIWEKATLGTILLSIQAPLAIR